MYRLISLMSYYYRNVVMENPLEAMLIMAVFGSAFQAITYKVAGLFYDSTRQYRAVGSMLYLFFFCVHSRLLLFYLDFKSQLIIPILAIIMYACILFKASQLYNKVAYK